MRFSEVMLRGIYRKKMSSFDSSIFSELLQDGFVELKPQVF